MQKNKKEKEFKEEKTYEWLIIPQSYLQAALMNARILKEKNPVFAKDEGKDSTLDSIYGNYSQDSKYLIFPIIFNFKHGIELYLKSISGIDKSEFIYGHDLKKLLEKIKENKKIKISKELESTIKKYYYSKLLLKNKEPDEKNQFERYPQDSPYDKIDFSEIKFIKFKDNNVIVKENKIDILIKDIIIVNEKLRNLSIEICENKKSS